MFVRIALGIDARAGAGSGIDPHSSSDPFGKGKGKERCNEIDRQAEIEVRDQVLGNDGISDPDGERFDQDAMNSSDSNSSSSSSGSLRQKSKKTGLSMQSNVEKALDYGRAHFKPFLRSHLNEIQRLFTFLLFLPAASLHGTAADGAPINSHVSSQGVPMQLDDSIMSFETAKVDFDLDAELDLDREVTLNLDDPNNHFGNPSLHFGYDQGDFEPAAMDVDHDEAARKSDDEDATRLPRPSPLHLSLLSILPEPYRPLLHPNMTHAPYLSPMFKIEFCARAGVAKEPPLRIGVEVGAGGALNRIWKVRNMMMKSGNEWSQGDELPVEIPLPPHLRFHSTFACPVSKEQGTEENPPMMMACGHVVCLESLNKLGRREGRLKCPYCPIESTVSQAIRVYF